METSPLWVNDCWEDDADELLRDFVGNNDSQTRSASPFSLPSLHTSDSSSMYNDCHRPATSSSPLSWTSSISPTSSDNNSSCNNDQSSVNRLISAVYSGPTLIDIENALSVTTGGTTLKELSHTRSSALDKSLSKPENRYKLKIKSASGGMIDDGYKWRKYGHKFIKNSPNPRSYYKCTNPRCGAKKQVERSVEDPNTLIITYEGLHLHFAYPYVFYNQSQQGKPTSKKPKISSFEIQERNLPTMIQNTNANTQSRINETKKDSNTQKVGSHGMLEDVVPLIVRNPTDNDMLPTSSSVCYNGHPSSPVSPTSLGWPHLPLF